MFRTLSQAVGFALSILTLMETTANADIMAPAQCWPDCSSTAENQQCQAWFGSTWYYCGWNAGWTYCCDGR